MYSLIPKFLLAKKSSKKGALEDSTCSWSRKNMGVKGTAYFCQCIVN